MFNIKRTGGQLARKGNYWNFSTGENVVLDAESVLPGDDQTIYYKLPPIAMIAIAPILGLVYAIFLPFVGLAMLAYVVANRVVAVSSDFVWKAAAFGWRPSEAYLAGRKARQADKKKIKDDKKEPNGQ